MARVSQPPSLSNPTSTSSVNVISPQSQPRYYILGTLQGTNHGRILKARDLLRDSDVVIKISSKSYFSSGVENPLAEARILKQIGSHPNISTPVSYHENELYIALVTEYLEYDLFQFIDRFGRLDEKSARKVFLCIAEAVKHLHSKGIVHLDISPENVLVDVGGSKVKLCDFGAAREVRESKTIGNGVVVGKKNYMPPQMLLRGARNLYKADMFSLGVTLFVMLFGHLPYDLSDRKNAETAHRLATGGIQKLKTLVAAYGYNCPVSEEAMHLMASLMAFNPKDRLSIDQVLKHTWLKSGQSTHIKAKQKTPKKT